MLLLFLLLWLCIDTLCSGTDLHTAKYGQGKLRGMSDERGDVISLPTAGEGFVQSKAEVSEGESTRKLVTTITYATNTALMGTLEYSITDSANPNIYDVHKWTIAPTSADRVLLVFSNFAFYSAEIIVEDSSGQLFSCASCGAGYVDPPIPPAFESTGGSISVTAFGAQGVSFSPSSFVLQYVAIVASASPALDYVSLQYNMGYAHVSPVLLTGGQMQAGSYQEWRVNTTEGSIGEGIVFTLSNLDLPSDCTTSLQVYDNNASLSGSNLLFSGCKSADADTQWMYSATSALYIYLDNTGRGTPTGMGFKLTYLGEKDLYKCGSLDIQQPDALTAQSGFIIDGSKSGPYGMRMNQDCEWLIQPSLAGTVTLLLHRVSLKYGSSVKVYDSNVEASGALLWDSGQANYYGGFGGESTIVPPPLTSTGSALYVVYKSSSLFGGGSYGFYGEYYTNNDQSLGVGNSDGEYLYMSSALGLSVPGDKTDYPGAVNYTWNIRPTDILSGSLINFALTSLYIPAAGDELVLYEGRDVDESNLLGRWNSNTATAPTNWLQTSTQEALLQFRSIGSASSSTVGNFKMSYFSDGPNYHCGYPINPIELEATSFTFTDGTSSNQQIFRNQSCNWVIDPPGTNGIYVFFTRFDMVGGSLEVYNGDSFDEEDYLFTIAESTGVPAPFFVDKSQIGIRYKTDATMVSGTGFSATYYRVPADASLLPTPGDGVIRLSSSSMLRLGNVATYGHIAPTTSLTYHVKPNASSAIYFFINGLNLTDCHGTVTIFDGADNTAASLGTFCGDRDLAVPSNWVYSSGPEATIVFQSDGATNYYGDFDISYYSDGSNSHCGFPTNPGILNGHSMIFTDGSASNETMFDLQECEWNIAPSYDDGSVIVIELLRIDLRGGGLLEVYDGATKATGEVVYRCRSCSVVPKPLVLRSGRAWVRFYSDFRAYEDSLDGPWASANFTGSGFKASYWTVNSTQASSVMPASKAVNGTVLELPPGVVMPNEVLNQTQHWYLGLLPGGSVQSLKVHPRLYTSEIVGDGGNSAGNGFPWQDGREYANHLDYQALTDNGLNSGYCGSMYGNVSALLASDEMTMAATQYASSYIQSRSDGKAIVNLYGSYDLDSIMPSDSITRPADTCKYIIDSGSTQSIDIRVKRAGGFSSSRLRIWTGLYGYDFLAYDSSSDNTGTNLNMLLRGYCGRATVLVESNTTDAAVGATLDHGFELTYAARASDYCTREICPDCRWYINSLIPEPPYVNKWLPYLIAMYSCLGACCLFFCGLYLRKLSRKYTPEGGWLRLLNPFAKIKIYKVVTPRHLKYTPKWDNFRNNWFLPVGECAICQDRTVCFKLPGCHHHLCIEDMHGYIGNALGDISQFPVKCPLHYEGCTSTIDAKIAKRVLDKNAFDKYNEFNDRVSYGEGMRCIFCANYVNFPEEGGLNMVECPYCVQHFCIRCKKPWHFESKCPLEGIDDSLDKWKDLSGAQKCPACSKLIEKNDVETCNHMVHKITDGIPCIRDRTDFCYCCGEEVLGDYPHDEVNHPGVNHFPDGVYQKCRAAMQKERDAERERLKRMRRMKGGTVKREQTFDLGENSKEGMGVDGDGWEKVPDHILRQNPGSPQGAAGPVDYFDAQWDTELGGDSSSSSPVSAGSPHSPHNHSPDSKRRERKSPALASVPSRLPTLAPVPARLPQNTSARNGGGGGNSRLGGGGGGGGRAGQNQRTPSRAPRGGRVAVGK